MRSVDFLVGIIIIGFAVGVLTSPAFGFLIFGILITFGAIAP